MILLKANRELDDVFHRLIQTMKVNVEWDGVFAVVDDYLILLGKVRSLFFNFETRKAVTNIIDIPVTEDTLCDIGENASLTNVLNMMLYVFGKWNSIPGLKVDKNYAQLDALFSNILKEISVQSSYNETNCRFFKNGIRLTYEDVIQIAIEAKKKKQEEVEESGEDLGLWHKICWNKDMAYFMKEDTTAEERVTDRIGNNFYVVGYKCPKCGEKLYMVVYPVGKELPIETQEGKVFLARAYTCSSCKSFYTPRPEKLLAEGDVYSLFFDSDEKAYEDYLELLGRTGERTSNYKFNEFEKDRLGKKAETAEIENLKDLTENLESMPPEELNRLQEKIEEGFFPYEEADLFMQENQDQIAAIARNVRNSGVENVRNVNANTTGKTEKETEKIEHSSSNKHYVIKKDSQKDTVPKVTNATFKNANLKENISREKNTVAQINSTEEKVSTEENVSKEEKVLKEEKASKMEKSRNLYDAKIKVFGRLSNDQVRELEKQIQTDKFLPEEEKKSYLEAVHHQKEIKRIAQLKEKADHCEKQNYIYVDRIIEEIEKENFDENEKQSLLARLKLVRKEKGESEAANIAQQMKKKINLKDYRTLRKKLEMYHDVDTSIYTKDLDAAYENAEKQEISQMVNRSRKVTRDDFTDLLKRLDEQDFKQDLVLPYKEKIVEQIRKLDQKMIDDLFPDQSNTSFDDVAAAYEAIENGVFLPELKVNALEMLDKRLKKIKSDECELLVQKLKDTFGSKIGENARIHYYPARQILMGKASKDEIECFDTALTIFAADRGRYEMPIVLFDTSKNADGREGVLISADHIFYGSRFDAGTIIISSVKMITAKNGLLNKGLYVTQRNGAKIRLHYPVENAKAQGFAEYLQEFVGYLQEKPESRKINYLAREKHDVICCFRCGYHYKGGNICPKCGYKINS